MYDHAYLLLLTSRHYVLALEVPMNDHGLLLVQVVAPHGHVGRDVDGLGQRQLHLLLVQQVVERACRQGQGWG